MTRAWCALSLGACSTWPPWASPLRSQVRPVTGMQTSVQAMQPAVGTLGGEKQDWLAQGRLGQGRAGWEGQLVLLLLLYVRGRQWGISTCSRPACRHMGELQDMHPLLCDICNWDTDGCTWVGSCSQALCTEQCDCKELPCLTLICCTFTCCAFDVTCHAVPCFVSVVCCRLSAAGSELVSHSCRVSHATREDPQL
jgi:hypothetical protein